MVFVGEKGLQFVESVAMRILEDLKNGGWLVNFEKSSLTPTQIGKWLGIIINTRTMTFYVPKDR